MPEPLRIDILSIFPEIFSSPLSVSILKRAQENGFLEVQAWDVRDYAPDKHQTTDDTPFGGGAGMVMKPDPVFRAAEAVLGQSFGDGKMPEGFQGRDERRKQIGARVILLTPQGEPFSQEKARELSLERHLVMICGRYEGMDERVREHLVTDEISIGDYVLTGGEIPALVVLDAVARLIPGVLGAEESPEEESFSEGLLEYPHYTRPADYRGWKVPENLLTGNHRQVEHWRREQSFRRTLERRPELLDGRELTAEEKEILAHLLIENQ